MLAAVHGRSRSLAMATIRSLVGLALGVTLITLALHLTETDLVGSFSRLQTATLLAAFAVHGFALMLLTVRWFLLLLCQDVRLPFASVFRLTMVGAFFNLLIPGPVSGDLAKGVLVSDPRSGRRAEAAVSILLDRIVGVSMLGILALAALALWLLQPSVESVPSNGEISRSIVGVLVSFATVVVLATISWPLVFTRAAPMLARLIPERLRPFADRVLIAVQAFRNSRSTIIRTALLTLGAHLLFIIALWIIANGISDTPVRLDSCFIAFQVGTVLSTVPATPGGIGVRDLGMALSLESLQPEVTGTAAIAVVISGIIVVWRLIGGFFLLWTIVVRSDLNATWDAAATRGKPADE